MFGQKKTFIRAVLAMVGTIIGAGIFAVPSVMGRLGFVTGTIVFAAVTLVVLATHLLYVEIISRDGNNRRLPGHIGAILGPWGKWLGVLTHAGQLMGAALAYLILGGEFLSVIAWRLGLPSHMLIWQLLFWCGGGVILLYGLKMMAKIEAALTWALVALLFVIILLAAPQSGLLLSGPLDASRTFEAIGVFIFALVGLMVISEIHDVNGRSISATRKSVAIGTIIAAVLTWLIGVFVAGSLGFADAAIVEQWSRVFPSALWWLVPTVGFLAVVTSFITGVFDLQEMIRLDLHQHRWMARVVTLAVPLILVLVISANFIQTISFVGGLFTATNGFLIAIAASRIMHRPKQRPSIWWREIIPLVVAVFFAVTFIQHVFSL